MTAGIGASLSMATERCPFCSPIAASPRQLLVSGEHFYVLAPAGQIVEGFLGVFTHSCRDSVSRLRCLDDIPRHCVRELRELQSMIAEFYEASYRAPAMFYEHGRGGSGTSSLPGGHFVFHPHLCAMPGPLSVHAALRRHLEWQPAPGWGQIRASIGKRPYLFVETPYEPSCPEPLVYFGPDLQGRQFLDQLSLKRLLVDENSLRTDSDWRKYPGTSELRALCERFERWYVNKFKRPSDDWLDDHSRD